MLVVCIHNITLGSQEGSGAVEMHSGTLHKVSKLD
jgi:hypothetical protein